MRPILVLWTKLTSLQFQLMQMAIPELWKTMILHLFLDNIYTVLLSVKFTKQQHLCNPWAQVLDHFSAMLGFHSDLLHSIHQQSPTHIINILGASEWLFVSIPVRKLVQNGCSSHAWKSVFISSAICMCNSAIHIDNLSEQCAAHEAHVAIDRHMSH